MWASHCAGLSGRRVQALGGRASMVGGSWALEHELGRCGTELLCDMCDPPGPEIKPVFLRTCVPELESGFITT